MSTQTHSHHVADLNDRDLCDAEQFNRLVSFREIDMNAIPSDLRVFDFCWSLCAFEHLGSIRQGLAFVIISVALLRPGGVAVHKLR